LRHVVLPVLLFRAFYREWLAFANAGSAALPNSL
jgi:hypothetical protein